jgi:hypothetical protein
MHLTRAHKEDGLTSEEDYIKRGSRTARGPVSISNQTAFFPSRERP